MSRFSVYFEHAALIVDETKQFPGQTIPGYWDLQSNTPSELIGVIIGGALARAARELNEDFDPIIERFMQVTNGVEIELKGDPGKIAAQRLRQAAKLNLEATESAGERLARLAGESLCWIEFFIHSPASAEKARIEAGALADQIKRAIADQRAGHVG